MHNNTADIGLIGLAVMGRNLALNLADHGHTVAVYNRSGEKTKEFVESPEAKGKKLVPCYSLEELAAAVKKPAPFILMIKAGSPVDAQIEQLVPLLAKDDIIMDGGNSFFADTRRRSADLAARGFRYFGVGISGGEEGARNGPSIMPGGDESGYKAIAKMLTDISAKVDGQPCCAYIGPDGAGHYVKMTHNGIEYADMQLIAEAYSVLKNIGGLDAEEMRSVFTEWNKGELSSYLIEITADILGWKDTETGKPLVEVVKDAAGQKGTGSWTSQSSLNLGIATPTIAEAVYARCISALKTEREAAEKILPGPDMKAGGAGMPDKARLIAIVRDALYAAKICCYAQGFALLKGAAAEYGWKLNYGEISMLWRGGCIIRAVFLARIKEAYDRRADLPNLLLDPYFTEQVAKAQTGWREIVALAARTGVPVPAFASALSYYDSYRTGRLPANLIQAQRDYFGAHTYERTDREGWFHTDWIGGK
jgi:6-phosphogluconate dehydrogenase